MRLSRLPSSTGGVSPRGKAWRLAALAAGLAAILTIISVTGREDAYPAEAATGSGLYVFGATTNTSALTNPYSSGTNPHFNWAQLEPSEGNYNWSGIDSALAAARQANRTVILRVFTNRSGSSQASPSWFFNSRGADYYYPSGSSYKSPVPWDTTYQEKFGRFLQALGQRYNGNSTIEFVQIAGVGVYGEMYFGYRSPSDYSVTKHKDAIDYWTDAWRSAFPSTNLSIAVNALGSNIGEGGASHAVSRGYFLQMNSPSGNSPTRAILATHDSSTKIVIEAENGGCQTATGSAFEDMIETIFSYGYSIHYLVLCNHSFVSSGTDAGLAEAVQSLDGGGTISPTATPTVRVQAPTNTPSPTATPRPATATPTQTPTPGPTQAQPTATATQQPQTPEPTPTQTFRRFRWRR